jgi:hypothetical protein
MLRSAQFWLSLTALTLCRCPLSAISEALSDETFLRE